MGKLCPKQPGNAREQHVQVKVMNDDKSSVLNGTLQMTETDLYPQQQYRTVSLAIEVFVQVQSW